MSSMLFVLRLSILLGWQDVKQAYRRSAIGPFWITGGMAVQVATMSLVFGLIFKADLKHYLPFLAISIVLWGFISASLTDGSNSFINADQIIRQLPLSPFVHTLRAFWKSIFTLAHNAIILPIVLVAVLQPIGLQTLLVIPGLILLALNLNWISMILAIASVRFRDLPPIVTSILTIAFYVTPVMWYPELIGNNTVAHFLLGLNPLYHLIQIVRLPLLNQMPTADNWYLSALFACVGWLVAILVVRRYQHKIAYWV